MWDGVIVTRSATRLENPIRGGDLFGDTSLPKYFKASEARGRRA